MTMEERIKNAAKREEIAKENEKNASIQKIQELVKCIMEKRVQIGEMITAANACVKYGLVSTAPCITREQFSLKTYGCDNTFFANGIHHDLGFMLDNKKNVIAMGIKAGGANGHLDLYVDGTRCYLQDEECSGYSGTFNTAIYMMMMKSVASLSKNEMWHTTYHLQKVLDQFSSFQNAFYAWLDVVAPDTKESVESEEAIATDTGESYQAFAAYCNAEALYRIQNAMPDKQILADDPLVIAFGKKLEAESESWIDSFVIDEMLGDFLEEVKCDG